MPCAGHSTVYSALKEAELRYHQRRGGPGEHRPSTLSAGHPSTCPQTKGQRRRTRPWPGPFHGSSGSAVGGACAHFAIWSRQDRRRAHACAAKGVPPFFLSSSPAGSVPAWKWSLLWPKAGKLRPWLPGAAGGPGEQSGQALTQPQADAPGFAYRTMIEAPITETRLTTLVLGIQASPSMS